ncbi:hypothetical protein K435DRAFT_851258 [Dendrothele bispora CBS 962.96]|uniref:Uncharacterized protein n=1 Tax=Dendrothele bispora (strain CBS 962.96) TaxID=1314807 RepID=A0A4S8MP60_DENBC|nr:hypothetical protein K435DRAFT_851258 [Dendrothele bispora CBS 962.96]
MTISFSSTRPCRRRTRNSRQIGSETLICFIHLRWNTGTQEIYSDGLILLHQTFVTWSNLSRRSSSCINSGSIPPINFSTSTSCNSRTVSLPVLLGNATYNAVNDNPAHTGDWKIFWFNPLDSPLKLSISPSINSLVTITAHFIPNINMGISALGGFFNIPASALSIVVRALFPVFSSQALRQPLRQLIGDRDRPPHPYMSALGGFLNIPASALSIVLSSSPSAPLSAHQQPSPPTSSPRDIDLASVTVS